MSYTIEHTQYNTSSKNIKLCNISEMKLFYYIAHILNDFAKKQYNGLSSL